MGIAAGYTKFATDLFVYHTVSSVSAIEHSLEILSGPSGEQKFNVLDKAAAVLPVG